MARSHKSQLKQRFAEHQIGRLANDNMFRGAWVEFLVADQLGADLSLPWSYFDMTWDGYRISVKQSVGPNASFDVAPKQFAWDPDLKGQLRGDGGTYEGWRGHKERPKQHWCDLYVFAWMEVTAEELRNLTGDQVLDPSSWKIAVASRDKMHEYFSNSKTAGGASIEHRFGFGPLSELNERAKKACGDGSCAIDKRPQECGGPW
jgi:hypothetical protein